MLLEPVGRGEMGVVYRAEDPAIHRTVAVKILHTANGLTPQQVELKRIRFLREGQVAGSIDHPNIIRVFDVGEDPESGDMYIVMEFVLGPSLQAVLETGALEPEKAASLIGQIASGLDAAHALGVIHRDIKPSNVLMASDGTAKIADFGITHVATSTLTLDMQELGTPAYMSPEQVKGKTPDSRTDLFSLGVLSYEMLAGRKPFEGSDVVSIAHAIVHAEPLAISVANPELSRSLDRVFDRILAKEPSDRFGSGQEFAAALRSSLDPVHVKRKRPVAVWGLVGAAVAAAVVVALLPRGSRIVPEPAGEPPVVVATESAPKAAPPKAGATLKTRQQAPTKKPPTRQPVTKAPLASSAPPVSPAARPPSRKVVPESGRRVAAAGAVVAPVPAAEVTIRFAHRVRRGTLVVSFDGKTIFEEKFSKAKMAVFQTTVWDPVRAAAGKHTVTARVQGDDGTAYVSEPRDLEFPSGKEIELHIGLKGGTLTVKHGEG